MKTHYHLSNPEFEKQFKTHQLSPALFDHEAHLRLAWIHIRQYGVEKAIQNIQVQLQSFVEYAGAKDKYNATLTVAAIKAVYHFMLKSKANNFKAFLTEFPRLKTDLKEVLNFHYSIDIFNSPKAKAAFLEPDLLSFD